MSEHNADVDRVCQVCGDKAFARNFGAIACESCKLFFRRALSSRRTPKCNFDNNCIITKINRKCKKCRLDKCYATGMRKELVMIRVNMKKDIDSNVNNSPSVSIPEDCSPSSDTTIEAMESNECANGFNDCFDFLLQTSDLSDEQIDEEIAEIEKSAIRGHNVTESDRQTMAIVRPIATYNKQLNELELNRLTELSRASLSFHIPL